MWQRLERWLANHSVSMTKEKYLTMCEQMGTSPSEEKCPPGFEDLELPIQQAIEIFNKLGDRVVPDIGYQGKNYEILPLFMDKVDNKEIFLETLVRLDADMIKRSAEQMKRAREKIKNK